MSGLRELLGVVAIGYDNRIATGDGISAVVFYMPLSSIIYERDSLTV